MMTGIQLQSRTAGGKPKNGVRRTRRGRLSLAEVANRQESTQERLLKSAIDAFAKHGFDAVTTSLIAENAGMAQSMVHYHFKSKEQIWKAAIEQLMRDLSERFPRQGRVERSRPCEPSQGLSPAIFENERP